MIRTMVADPSAPHPDFEPALIGQVIEWAAWSHLVAAGGGDLLVDPAALGELSAFAVPLEQLPARLED